MLYENVKLAPLNQSDWALFLEMNQCSRVMKYVYDCLPLEVIRFNFSQRIIRTSKESESWYFSITDSKTNEKVGNIGMQLIDKKQGISEVGFMLKPNAHGKGYATDALKLLVEHAFETLHMQELTATCATNNIGSYKLLEKVGFTRIRKLTKNTMIKGVLVDDSVYSITNKSA
ncbi:GNAT family N-acetyltransferase [Pseudoalteromonas sp. MMG012]|uniref:GNAT family N-acetyltransferase n=1 Tax=Pseudoalteromonas sp. MMG012 TaxID=2822686 RepID=UPI001B3A541A|nr:GNAT family N-acetyltransferase [Pseudoalteromonas sp. MMG012]MBQ4849843.1 GNAT family N-acetyltransferase [Pseudoalteromonas sp. MMG012]